MARPFALQHRSSSATALQCVALAHKLSHAWNRDKEERMQRIRIGLTGLAFVFLLVLLGTAISRSSDDAPPTPGQNELSPIGRRARTSRWPKSAPRRASATDSNEAQPTAPTPMTQ